MTEQLNFPVNPLECNIEELKALWKKLSAKQRAAVKASCKPETRELIDRLIDTAVFSSGVVKEEAGNIVFEVPKFITEDVIRANPLIMIDSMSALEG